MESPEAKRYLRVSEAARLLDVSQAHIYAMCSRGELRVARVGKALRIPSDAIDELAGSSVVVRAA